MKTFYVKVNGKEYEVEIEEKRATPGKTEKIVAPNTPKTAQSAIASTPQTASSTGPGFSNGKITAPMPGTVLSIACSKGQNVKKGEILLVLEAMKMENEIQSPADGTVQEIMVAKGQSVDAGEILVQLTI